MKNQGSVVTTTGSTESSFDEHIRILDFSDSYSCHSVEMRESAEDAYEATFRWFEKKGINPGNPSTMA